MKKLIEFLPLAILGLTPLIWFFGKGNVLINGVDTNFPLDPGLWFIRRLFVWNDLLNAGSDFSSSTAGIFFHLIQAIPYKLGFNLQLVEITSLVFWFTLICLSAYFFARLILPGNRLIQLLFVTLYAFNTYLFNTWENVKVSNLSLIAALPLGLGLLTLLKMGKITLPNVVILSSLTGIILSGAGINPSYFFTFYLAIFIYLIGQILSERSKAAFINGLRNFFLIGGLVFTINLFWILPTALFFLGNISPIGSIDKLGFTNWIDSLSENTSLLNVLRLQGAWDWYTFDEVTNTPLYIPYALNYFYKIPFIIFSFLIPFLAFISFLIFDKKNKHYYIAFAIMIAVGSFLGAGTHLPTGTFYRELVNRVPFFSIFRSPWYIFTPLVIISYAGLISLFFYNLSKVNIKRLSLLKILVPVSVSVLILANLIYSYPLITGKIFRPGRNDSFYVEFPQYVFSAKQWLDNQNNGRIIIYPDDEIENFKWGYRGIESILSLLSDQQLLYSSLNTPDAPIARLVKEFNLSLKKNQIDLAKNLSAKLNIGMIFEKKDQQSLSPKLSDGATQSLLSHFGDWYFYKFPQADILPKVYSADKLFFGYPYKNGEKFIGVLDEKSILINPDDNQVRSIPKILDLTEDLILANNSQLSSLDQFNSAPSNLKDRFAVYDLSKVHFEFEIQNGSVYMPILERYHLEEFGINYELGKKISLELDGVPSSWEIDRVTDTYVYFKNINLTSGKHRLSIQLDNKNLIKGGDFEGQAEFKQVGAGEFAIEKNEQGHNLSILNKGLEAREPSADFIVSSFDPFATYFIALKYQQIYGNNASSIVYQQNQNTLIKAQTERLPNYPQMHTFNFFYNPVVTDSTMRISLIAPLIKDPLGTKVIYDDLFVYKIFSNNLIFAKANLPVLLDTPEVKLKRISPVYYKAEIDKVSGSHVIVFSENYSPFWEVSLFSETGEKLKVVPIHFSTNLYANAWYIPETPKKYQMIISYQRQKLWLIGFIISSLTLLTVTTYFVAQFISKRVSGKNKL
ncbi:MAG: DUF3367 domain-containing protein [Candidatus Daviesbacteria bacterium]|nr:MAG: DUF3367 domain-containing protein [Candidatus Daviesbacteria bacterium]